MSAKSDGIIYLDHHATTPCAPEVVEAMLPYFIEKFGNPSSVDHRYGAEAADAVERAREQVAKLVNSRPEEIIFTSGATESNNLAIFGTTALAPKDKRHIITTQVEHKAVLEPMKRLETQGWNVTYLAVDEYANIDLGELEEAIGEDTFLISIMAANNEVGTIYPLKEIGKLAKKYGVLFHSDAAQAVGHIPVDVNEMGIDLLSMSAHKMYGPKGIGAMFLRRRDPKISIRPRQLGGGHERGLRAGTLGVPLIVGLGVAARIGEETVRKRDDRACLRDNLWNELQNEILGLNLNGSLSRRLPQNLNFHVVGISAEAFIRLLAPTMAVSSSSACQTAARQASHVLLAMGQPTTVALESIRLGIGKDEEPPIIEKVVQSVNAALRKIRSVVV